MLEKYIGKTLFGFCNGYFGRDSYSNKKIVYAGNNYIVAENDYGKPVVAYFEDESIEEIICLIETWMFNDGNEI